MTIALIAAAAGKDLVIGKQGDLPWHFPSDLKFFKETTSGHPVLMGRVTYESILKRIGKPLPGRRNIVMTRDKNFKDDRITIIHDAASISAQIKPDETLFVIGGAKVYQQVIDHADVIYMTHIDQDIKGDAFFPPLDKNIWQLASRREAVENSVVLKFCVYKRMPNA